MRRPVLLILAGAALSFPAFAQAQTPAPADAAPAATPAPLPPYGTPIGLEHARRLVAAAEAEARRQGFTMAIAVVEPTGALVAFEKMDGTQYGSVGVAQAKARTAALYRRPSKSFADRLAASPGIATLDGVVAVEGGVPILVDGKIIGAIGVSGGSSAQDGAVAAAALAAVSR